MDKFVSCAKQERVATITISRPNALNALSVSVCEQLTETMQTIIADETVHAVIIQGEGENFIAGADIGSMVTANVLEAEAYARLVGCCLQTVSECPVPVIASIRGYALGGGMELALACDLRLAGESAKFGFPEINLGIIPGAGGTQRLPRVTGTAKAMELILLGQIIDAQTAFSMGLLNAVYLDDILAAKTTELAAKIAAKPLQAVKKVKQAVQAALDLDIRHGLAYEIGCLTPLFSTFDQKEGMAAFVEKRKPIFMGK